MSNLVDQLQITSVYSADPIRPNSSAPQLPKIIDLRGLHLPATERSRDYLSIQRYKQNN